MQSCGFGPKYFQAPSLMVARLPSQVDLKQAEKLLLNPTMVVAYHQAGLAALMLMGI